MAANSDKNPTYAEMKAIIDPRTGKTFDKKQGLGVLKQHTKRQVIIDEENLERKKIGRTLIKNVARYWYHHRTVKDDLNKAQRALRNLREIRKEKRVAQRATERACAKLQKAALEQANFDEDNLQREKAGQPLVESLNLRWWYYGRKVGEELVKNKAQLDLREIRERRNEEGSAADTDIFGPEANKPGSEQREKTPETTEEDLEIDRALPEEARMAKEKKDRDKGGRSYL